MKLLNANEKGFALLLQKTIIFLVLILLLAGIASAECIDTDGGKNYAEKGKTKIVSGKEDICILSPSAEVRQDTSPYMKEYYCDKDDQIKSEIIECIREGFEKCEMGKCVGGEAEAKAKDENYTAPPPEPSCGNMIVDPGEECDPMNKMCFDEHGNIGLCDENCMCEVKIVLDGSEETEEENETEDAEIEEVEPVENEVEEQEEEEDAPSEEEEEKQEITVTIAEKHRKPEPKGFFARMWAWISGLFN